MKTKPIVPWMGGKRRLVSQLTQKMPEHECYVELFAGGAALFFMREQASKVEVINDLNGELVNLYRVVQHHLEEFVRQFKWSLVSRQMFDWLKNANIELMTDMDDRDMGVSPVSLIRQKQFILMNKLKVLKNKF